jgi:hypothetical protein
MLELNTTRRAGKREKTACGFQPGAGRKEKLPEIRLAPPAPNA